MYDSQSSEQTTPSSEQAIPSCYEEQSHKINSQKDEQTNTRTQGPISDSLSRKNSDLPKKHSETNQSQRQDADQKKNHL